MNLSVKERIILPRLLPQNGNYYELVAVRKICELIKISKDEEKSLGISMAPNGQPQGLTEEKEKTEKGFDLTQDQVDLIAKELKVFEEKGHLNMEIIELFEKFVGAPEKEEPVVGEQKLLPEGK